MSICEQIIERHKRYGRTQQAGEWGKIQELPRAQYLALLDAGDPDALEAHLQNFFQSTTASGLVSWDGALTEENQAEFANALRHNLDMWSLYTGEDDLSILEAPLAGNPIRGVVNGIHIMLDTPRHDRYAKLVTNLVPEDTTILEIGCGYGGFALQMLRRQQVIIGLYDLPETLYLAWWWLTSTTDYMIGWDASERVDVLLIPAGSKIWGLWDVVTSAHSLPEIPAEIVNGYMEQIRDARPLYFFHDSAHARIQGDGSLLCEAYPEVMASQIDPGPGYREVYRAPTPWARTGGRYWEFLYRRDDG